MYAGVTIIPKRPIPFSYWVIPGVILAGEYPGKQITFNPKRTLRTLFDTVLAFLFLGTSGNKGTMHKIGSLIDAGITLFLDLTEDGELPSYQKMLEAEACKSGRKVSYQRIPVKDRDIATKEQLVYALTLINDVVTKGGVVYIHCMRGIGRTGLVVGTYLVQKGMTGQEALDDITRLRKGLLSSWWRSPETEVQRRMVLEWKDDYIKTSV